MTDCRKCKRVDVECCYTCERNSEECNVWHKCGEDCPKYIKAKQTNSDRIRQMTDEELAEWLTRITDDAQLDARTRCDYQWDEWLKEEVEEKDE